MNMKNLLSFEEALQMVDDHTVVLQPVALPLDQADGKVLAETLVADENVPPFANSAMDGYAVRSQDTHGASENKPVLLKLIGSVFAGQWPDRAVQNGEALQIMTGAPMPEGADAVVMVEHAASSGGEVRIFRPAQTGDHYRPAGDDIAAGDEVLKAGRALDAYDIGVAASIGRASLKVFPKPTVALLSTGDELVRPGDPLPRGKIRASSTYALAAQLRGLGCTVHDFGIVEDDPKIIRDVIRRAFDNDVVLSTGGVSMGEHDYVRNALADAGVDLKFWKVKQKPGKPLVFGVRGPRLFFGLPGNPVSTLLCYKLFVERAIRKMSGLRGSGLPRLIANLKDDIHSNPALTHFVRARVFVENGQVAVSVTPKQSSGVLSSLAHSNALIVAGEGISDIPAGSEVTILLTRPMESVGDETR